MKQNVLVFAGTKQSGKSTAAKFIHGFRMKEAGSIRCFDISADGELLVNASFRDTNGDILETNNAILDIYRQDFEFGKYAHEKIWPYAKVYNFAEELKEACIRIFGLNPKNVYGSDEDKNQPTSIKWQDVWPLLSNGRKDEIIAKYRKENYLNRFLSHREFLQDYGTLCRIIQPNCWVEACWRKIKDEGYPYIIIDDCRYENEVDISTGFGAKIVLLTLQPFKDSHSSEKIHTVDRKKFHFVLDNANMTIEEKHRELVKILNEVGWTTAKLEG